VFQENWMSKPHTAKISITSFWLFLFRCIYVHKIICIINDKLIGKNEKFSTIIITNVDNKTEH
jgi:hypothetical protein